MQAALTRIEKIKIDDEVLSWNEQTEKLEWKFVLDTYIRKNNKLIVIQLVNGTIIKATPEHPFFVEGSWINASELKEGMKLLSSELNKVLILSVNEEILSNEIDVFNLNIQDNHNYFAENILVHNKYNSTTGKQQLDIANNHLQILSTPYQSTSSDGMTTLHGDVVSQIPETPIATNDQTWQINYNKSLNNFIQFTSNNSNLTEIERQIFAQKLIQIQLASFLYTPQQLNQYSNPVNQQTQIITLQIKRAQANAGYNSALFVFSDKGNLVDAQKQIDNIILSIDKDTNLSPEEKARLTGAWQGISQRYADPQTGAVLATVFRPLASVLGAAGLVKLGPVLLTALQGGIQTLTGIANMIVGLSQTPAGREVLAKMFVNGASENLVDDIAAIGNNPVAQQAFFSSLQVEGPAAAVAQVLGGSLLGGLLGVSKGAGSYLVKVLNNTDNVASLSAAELKQIGQKYESLDSVFSSNNLKVSSEQTTVFRYNNPNTSAGQEFQVFKGNGTAPPNQMLNHRYTIGGRQGDEALYVALDPTTAFKEVGEKTNYVLSSKEVSLNKVLDLTDPNNLQILNLSKL